MVTSKRQLTTKESKKYNYTVQVEIELLENNYGYLHPKF